MIPWRTIARSVCEREDCRTGDLRELRSSQVPRSREVMACTLIDGLCADCRQRLAPRRRAPTVAEPSPALFEMAEAQPEPEPPLLRFRR